MPLGNRLLRSDTTATTAPTNAATATPPMRRARRFSLQHNTAHLKPILPSSDNQSTSPTKSPQPPWTKPTAASPSSRLRTAGPVHSTLKVLVMGSCRVGKTSIVQRFLHDTFNPKYRSTIEENHHAQFTFHSAKLSLEILDTGGSYEFPAMLELNIASSDAFLFVYSPEEPASLDQVGWLRGQVTTQKGEEVPMVLVCNHKEEVEPDVLSEARSNGELSVKKWGHCGFVVCSAKTGHNVTQIFKELLSQAKVQYKLSPAMRKRRQSLPGGMMGIGQWQSRQIRAQATSPEVPGEAEIAALGDRAKRNSCTLS